MKSISLSAAVISLAMLAGCNEGSTANGAAPAAEKAASVPAPGGRQWSEVVSRTPEGGYRMGNPDAAVKLVEYGSRTCHVCAQFDAEATEPLRANYIASGRVSYEYRDYLRNPVDIAATLIGECNGTEPFFPLVHQMMAGQEALLERAGAMGEAQSQRIAALPPAQQFAGWAEAVGLIEWAKQRGVAEAKARQCLADTAKVEALVAANQTATERYQIAGTPTFLINGERADATSWSALEPLIRAAGG